MYQIMISMPAGELLIGEGDADDSQMDAILAGRYVRLDSEPHRMRVPEGKPDIAPTLPNVRL